MILADTDVVIDILRRNPVTLMHLTNHLRLNGTLAVSAVTMYEVERGLHVRKAAVQRQQLNTLRPQITILPVDERVSATAVEIYLHLRSTNNYLPDADIMIASTAATHRFVLATANSSHFDRIPDLKLIDWRLPLELR